MTIDDFNLTNDAKYLIGSMYKVYIDKRKDNVNKQDARQFSGIKELKGNLMPEWTEEDILDTCWELKRKDLITGMAASNTLYRIAITTDAVSALEVSFMDRADKVIDYISKIKNSIPFL